MINTATQAPLKLTDTNYFPWRAQFYVLLIGYDLYIYIDGSLPCPSFAFDHFATISLDQTNKLLLCALLASFLLEANHVVLGAQTSHTTWNRLSITFAKSSRNHLFCFCKHLIKPQSSWSIMEYLHDIKDTYGEYDILSTATNNDEMILYVINGLSIDFWDIYAAIRICDSPLSFSVRAICWTQWVSHVNCFEPFDSLITTNVATRFSSSSSYDNRIMPLLNF